MPRHASMVIGRGLLVLALSPAAGSPLRLVSEWSQAGTARIECPIDLAVTPAGKLLVACFLSALVEVDPEAALAGTDWHPKLLFGDPRKVPHQVFSTVALHPETGEVYLANKYEGRILRLMRGSEGD